MGRMSGKPIRPIALVEAPAVMGLFTLALPVPRSGADQAVRRQILDERLEPLGELLHGEAA